MANTKNLKGAWGKVGGTSKKTPNTIYMRFSSAAFSKNIKKYCAADTYVCSNTLDALIACFQHELIHLLANLKLIIYYKNDELLYDRDARKRFKPYDKWDILSPHGKNFLKDAQNLFGITYIKIKGCEVEGIGKIDLDEGEE